MQMNSCEVARLRPHMAAAFHEASCWWLKFHIYISRQPFRITRMFTAFLRRKLPLKVVSEKNLQVQFIWRFNSVFLGKISFLFSSVFNIFILIRHLTSNINIYFSWFKSILFKFQLLFSLRLLALIGMSLIVSIFRVYIARLHIEVRGWDAIAALTVRNFRRSNWVVE